jgi:hypothetical protein
MACFRDIHTSFYFYIAVSIEVSVCPSRKKKGLFLNSVTWFTPNPFQPIILQSSYDLPLHNLDSLSSQKPHTCNIQFITITTVLAIPQSKILRLYTILLVYWVTKHRNLFQNTYLWIMLLAPQQNSWNKTITTADHYKNRTSYNCLILH